MIIGGSIKGRPVSRSILWDKDGNCWEILSATPTGRTKEVVVESEPVFIFEASEYEIEIRLCLQEDLNLFLEEKTEEN